MVYISIKKLIFQELFLLQLIYGIRKTAANQVWAVGRLEEKTHLMAPALSLIANFFPIFTASFLASHQLRSSAFLVEGHLQVIDALF